MPVMEIKKYSEMMNTVGMSGDLFPGKYVVHLFNSS